MAKTTSIQILFTKRNAPKNGPTSSAKMNDMIEEIAHDLASFSDQWNNSLITLLDTLPDGSIDVDAFVDGLSGNTLYTYDQASSTFNAGYYNNVKSRPYTVYEQFVNIYANIDSIKEELEEKISQSTPIAEQIAITDAAGFFTSLNVEDALAELKSEITIFDGSQFVLLDGSSGGQTVTGGTAASNNLTLVSTSHSTKGKIIFGTSAYDEVNNRLGLGTTTPTVRLDVSGTINATAANISSGNVGIGSITSPSYKLSISTTGTELAGTVLSNALVVTAGVLGNTAGNTIKVASFGGFTGNSTSLGIKMYRHTSAASWENSSLGLVFDVDSTEEAGGSIWIKAGGSIGFNTGNPQYLLHAYRNTSTDIHCVIQNGTNGYATSFHLLGNDSAGAAFNRVASMYGSSNHWYIGGDGVAQTMVLATNNTERARISSTGFFGIGNTSPEAKLHIAGTYTSNRGQLYVEGVADHCYLVIDTDNAANEAGYEIRKGDVRKWVSGVFGSSDNLSFYDTQTRVTFKVGGNVGIANTDPSYLLDIGHNGASTHGVALRIFQNVIGNSDGPKIEFRKTMTSTKSWAVGVLNGVDVDDFTISEDTIGGTSFGTPRLVVAAGGNVGIGTSTPATSAKLDVSSTTGAILFPRMNTTERDALTAVNGMVIYNTSTDKLQVRAAGSWVDLH